MDTDTFGDGLWASLKVKAAYCPSYCMVHLDRYIGFYNGNRLRAEIRLGKWQDNQMLEYRVREVDSSGNTLRAITRGYFGANTGKHWSLNETVILAVALEGNEFIFYTDNYDQIAKVQLLGPITPFQTSQPWRVSIWTEAANDSMTAEVSGFLAIDVSDTVPVLPSLGIVGVWAMTEYEGPNTCGDPVGAYVDSYNMVIQDTGVITEGDWIY
jgi:hypothetical protein